MSKINQKEVTYLLNPGFIKTEKVLNNGNNWLILHITKLKR